MVEEQIYLYKVSLSVGSDTITGEVVGKQSSPDDDIRFRVLRDKGIAPSKKSKWDKWSKARVVKIRVKKINGIA